MISQNITTHEHQYTIPSEYEYSYDLGYAEPKIKTVKVVKFKCACGAERSGNDE